MSTTSVRTKNAMTALQEAAAASRAAQSDTGAQTGKMPSPSTTTLLSKPVWYYNSRYPQEVYRSPVDPNQRDPESFHFLNGQFCATKEWQKEILDKQPHVFPEDVGIEAIDPCPECGYKTGSMKDFNAHMRSHL